MPERRDVYERLADELRQAIVSGRYKPGDRLPSTLELMERTGVANLTVRGAYRVLVEEGLVESVTKKGFYVRRPNAMTWRMNPATRGRRVAATCWTGGPPTWRPPGWRTARRSASRSRTPRRRCWARRWGSGWGCEPGSRVLVRRAIRYTGPAER